MSIAMKRIAHSSEIDLRNWTFVTDIHELEALMRGFVSMVTDILRQQFEDDPPTLNLPFEWTADGDGRGGPRPDDPLTLYVNLQLGPDEEGVTYACSLEDAIDDVIELNELPDGSGKVDDDEGREVCGKIAARLRELAAKLDAACAPEPK